MKILIVATHKKSQATLRRVVEVDEKEESKAKQEAELTFLNEYINRDGHIKIYNKVTDAKSKAMLSIKTSVVND